MNLGWFLIVNSVFGIVAFFTLVLMITKYANQLEKNGDNIYDRMESFNNKVKDESEVKYGNRRTIYLMGVVLIIVSWEISIPITLWIMKRLGFL